MRKGAERNKGSGRTTDVAEGKSKPLSAKEQQRHDKQNAIERARGLRESQWLDGIRWRQSQEQWQQRETAALNALFPPTQTPQKKLMNKGKRR